MIDQGVGEGWEGERTSSVELRLSLVIAQGMGGDEMSWRKGRRWLLVVMGKEEDGVEKKGIVRWWEKRGPVSG